MCPKQTRLCRCYLEINGGQLRGSSEQRFDAAATSASKQYESLKTTSGQNAKITSSLETLALRLKQARLMLRWLT